MEVTPALFDHIAHLARLQFNGEDSEALRLDMQRMVSFMEKLNELDTNGIEPLRFMGHHAQRLREDEPRPGIGHEAGLQNAPQTDGTYFIVPKVIENPN
jgi:aspartyl-tRNA(Asn)/glutamyl-tRNA(Gln) amidotransferase subunit C